MAPDFGTRARASLVVGILSLLYKHSHGIDCGVPQSPTYGTVTYPALTSGSFATYTCDYGYLISGVSSTMCFDGFWSDPAPSCIPVDCGPVIPNPNSFVDCAGGTIFGSSCIAGCDVGYYITGSTFMQCIASGIWDYPPPLCTIVDCMVLVPPQDGTVSYTSGTTYGSQGIHACNPDFSLSGPEIRLCQPNGVWSLTAPFCLADVCTAPLPPARGSVICGSQLVGGMCTFSCDDGYTMNGSSISTCQTTGQWDLEAPTCLFTGGGSSCSQRWTSPSSFSMQSLSTSQLKFSIITSLPASSVLSCARICRNQAESFCDMPDECKVVEFDPALKVCTMYRDDEVAGTTIVCPVSNKCYRQFISL